MSAKRSESPARSSQILIAVKTSNGSVKIRDLELIVELARLIGGDDFTGVGHDMTGVSVAVPASNALKAGER